MRVIQDSKTNEVAVLCDFCLTGIKYNYVLLERDAAGQECQIGLCTVLSAESSTGAQPRKEFGYKSVVGWLPYRPGEAYDEVAAANGAGDTSIAALRLAGKTLANGLTLGARCAKHLAKELPNHLAKEYQKRLDSDEHMSPETRKKMQDHTEKYKR